MNPSFQLPVIDQKPNTYQPQNVISESLSFLQEPKEEQELHSHQPKNKTDPDIKKNSNIKKAEEEEEEKKENVTSTLVEPNMPPCRSVEEFRQLVEIKEKANINDQLFHLRDQLFKLQLKKIEVKNEAEANTLSAKIKLYEQRIQEIENSLALDMLGPRVPFEPRQGVPLLPEKGIFPPKHAVPLLSYNFLLISFFKNM